MSCNVASDILLIAECPVCFDIMRPPIYQCNTGQSICSNCKLLLPYCPSCDSKIGSARNFALEALITSVLERPCPFAKYGCQMKLKEATMKDHCQVCTYREYECVFCDGGSTWLGPLDELRRHLLDVHEDFILYHVGEDSQNSFVLPNSSSSKFKFLIVGDALIYFYQTYSNRDTINRYVDLYPF
ncbi:Seven in absentia protein family [Popillia japonica]|uniref:RING-type E3 ubiquitin transferase n=1 Tax=Popillia japonica TaxID=7064 RepID=A0AAW1KS97_POPJA